MAKDKFEVLICPVVGRGYTHVSFFMGKAGMSRTRCGDLCFRNEEWRAFLAMLQPAPDCTPMLRDNDTNMSIRKVVK